VDAPSSLARWDGVCKHPPALLMDLTTDRAPETISSPELLRRVRQVADARLAAGSLCPPPQPIFEGAEAIAPWGVYPWRRPPPGRPAAATYSVALDDLLDLRAEVFVTRAHQALLGRDPTSAELERWARRVAGVWPEVPAVVLLRYSREARARGARIHVRWRRLATDGGRFVLRRLRALWRHRG
jgi:hypothetical protein